MLCTGLISEKSEGEHGITAVPFKSRGKRAIPASKSPYNLMYAAQIGVGASIVSANFESLYKQFCIDLIILPLQCIVL